MSEIPSKVNFRLYLAKEAAFRTFRPKAYERRKAFKTLWEHAIGQSERDTKLRVLRNPVKTPAEQSLGLYAEELEPQVREAVMKMRERGYSIFGGGFWDYIYQHGEIENALPNQANTTDGGVSERAMDVERF